MSTDAFVLSDGAYVLGALSPTERSEYETHLEGCATCATSVGELADLPALMSTVSIEQLTSEAEAPPATMLPSLVRLALRERARRRLAPVATALAAACLITVGAVAITRPDSPAPPVAASASPPSGTANLALAAVVRSPVTASARLVDMAWGTRIDLTCAYRPIESRGTGAKPAKGIPYVLVVIDRNGGAEQVASWKALPDRELSVMGASSQARPDIAAVEVRTRSGRAILRLSTLWPPTRDHRRQ